MAEEVTVPAQHPLEQERATFVDGIGPPLEQLREDYADVDGYAARDVRALISAYLALAGEHQQLWEAAKDVLDYEHHPKRLALSKLRTAIEAPR